MQCQCKWCANVFVDWRYRRSCCGHVLIGLKPERGKSAMIYHYDLQMTVFQTLTKRTVKHGAYAPLTDSEVSFGGTIMLFWCIFNRFLASWYTTLSSASSTQTCLTRNTYPLLAGYDIPLTSSSLRKKWSVVDQKLSNWYHSFIGRLRLLLSMW